MRINQFALAAAGLVLAATAQADGALKPEKVVICAACHGENGVATQPMYPNLAGQYPDYLANALKSYAVDGNPHYGRSNAVMGAMAKPLKDETIAEIADYLGSLPGELRTVPQAKFK